MGSKLWVMDAVDNDDEVFFEQGLRVSLKRCSDIDDEEILATISEKVFFGIVISRTLKTKTD